MDPLAHDLPRRIALDGAVNFRDLGGYRSRDGRSVRWRQVFRSDSLAELSERDLATLAGLGLRSLCDLRHAEEREHKPNRLPPALGLPLSLPGFYPQGADVMMAKVRAGQCSPAAAHQHLIAAYRAFPVVHRAHYAQWLQSLLSPAAYPALVHCTSGKDRTGFAATVLLLALDVPRETIAEDYALTNVYRRDLAFMLGHAVDPAVLDVVKQAHPDYLAAAFDSMDQHWGSPEGFLRDGLGLSAADRVALQALLLD